MSRATRVRAVRVLAVTAALVLAGGCGAGGDVSATRADTGADAPATVVSAPPLVTTAVPATTTVPAALRFEVAAVDGSRVVGSSLVGKKAVVWFWTPWCTICRAEAGEVAEAAAKYGSKISFLGVAGHGQVSAMRRFVDDTGVGGFAHAVDADGRVWSGFGVTGQPSFAFLDAAGNLDIVPGSLSPADLEERIGRLLAS